MSILLDASYFLALLNQDDVHHPRAREIAVKIDEQSYGIPFTTDHILDETISVALRKWGKERAIYCGTYVLKTVQLVVSDEHFIQQSWRLFQETKLQLSFTDCLNVMVCQAFQSKYIATFDKEFKRVPSLQIIN